ncbi:MAG TPA: cytochrome c/FTR1 family iron permease [Thermodesulfobacteriota bacterium]|nr:cytochrome c/FTR1 family iron permease [Thermodesulfobacteriota bacterium]
MRKTAIISVAAVLLLLVFALPSYSSPPEAKRILSLVDYIGGDYRNAVSGGEIINGDEYREMLEFSSEVGGLFSDMEKEGGDSAGLGPDLARLSGLIKDKADPAEVERLSASIKSKIITAYNIVPHPPEPPSVANGEALYGAQCSLCHGTAGAGDGPVASGLNPAPANFIDPEVSSVLSPFKVYNTMFYGIAGTGMPSFPQLSDEEKWDVAFYVMSLGWTEADVSKGEAAASGVPADLGDYKTLATLSNSELEGKISESVKNPGDAAFVLAYLRKGAAAEAPSGKSPVALTKSLLAESMDLYKKGETDAAYKKALDAYLEGFEKVETDLFVKDKALATGIESRFGELRGAMKSGKPADEVLALGSVIDGDLTTAGTVLTSGDASTYISFVNSFAIIVREGLEAILIIAAIIAFMGASGATRQIKYIHYGWILALAAGLATWFLASTLISISGMQRELIEGITSIVAAVVLFYVSYWLISKVDVRVWKHYIKGKVERALSTGSVVTLASVSFFAVYREAFETVLFYQALWLQAGNSRHAVIWGAVAGAAVLVVLFYVIFKLALRIPLKYFFSFTSVFLYLLAFILIGKGIKEFQEAGIVGITPLGFLPQIDVLGFYPTLETAVPQAVLLLAFLFAVFWMYSVNGKKRPDEAGIPAGVRDMRAALGQMKSDLAEWKGREDGDELGRKIEDAIARVGDLEERLSDLGSSASSHAHPQGTK